MNDRLRFSKVSWKFRSIYNFTVNYPWNLLFFKSDLLFNSFYCLFCLSTKLFRLNNLKTRTGMNAKFSRFDICVKAIMYLLFYNLHECNFNWKSIWNLNYFFVKRPTKLTWTTSKIFLLFCYYLLPWNCNIHDI